MHDPCIMISFNCVFYPSDGLHLTEEGNAVVHNEVVRAFSEGGLSTEHMQCDFPHHIHIDWHMPERAFQKK